jgi:hypothetical protein
MSEHIFSSSLAVTPDLAGWVYECFRVHRGLNEPCPKSLILWGADLDGTSLWVKQFGRHQFFEHLRYDISQEMDRFDPSECDYVVFRDYFAGASKGVKGVPSFRGWFGGGPTFDLSLRLRRTRRIVWGKPSILLTVQDPLDGLDPVECEWVQGHCEIVHITGEFLTYFVGFSDFFEITSIFFSSSLINLRIGVRGSG